MGGNIFGGMAQMIAGLQELKTGNNFGYCAFTGYGCFWISLTFLLIGNHYDLYNLQQDGHRLVSCRLDSLHRDPVGWLDAYQ